MEEEFKELKILLWFHSDADLESKDLAGIQFTVAKYVEIMSHAALSFFF